MAVEYEGEADVRAFALAMADTELGVCIYDARNRLVFWNHRARELSGYPASLFFTGITLDEQIAWSARQGYYGSGDPDRLAAERLATVANSGIYDIYYFRTSGEPVLLRAWRHRSGILLYLVEERFEYRGLIEAASEGFVIADYHGRIAEFNPGAEAMFGWKRKEVFGRSFDSLFENFDGSAGALRAAGPLSLNGLRPNNGTFPAEVSIVRIATRSGPITGAIVRDVSARKQTERALRESRAAEELLVHAVENISDGFAVFDAADRLVTMNERYMQSLSPAVAGDAIGRTYEELMRTDVARGYYRDALGREEEFIRQRLQAHRQSRSAFTYQNETGQWIQARDNHLPDGSIVAIRTDVTELIERGRALRESEANLAAAQQIAKLGSWELDLVPGRSLWAGPVRWSRETFRIFGETAEAGPISNERFFRAVHPDDRQRVAEAMTRSIENGAPYNIEHRVVRPDGSVIDVLEKSEVLRSAKTGEAVKVVGTVQDVTEQKATEATLRRYQTLLSSMERIAGVGGWERDLVSGEEIWTDGLYLILGRKREELGPSVENLLLCVHAEDRARVESLLVDGLQGPGTLEIEYRILRPGGTERIVSSQIELWRDEGGRALRMIGTVADVTESRAAQAEIERQREVIHHREKLGALGSLLAGVAHELNNPLSIVVAQASLLQEMEIESRIAARAEKIHGAAERCARIVKTFLAMARQRPPSRAAVNVNEAVSATLELLEYGLRAAGIELRRELADELPPIWADPDQIGQILTNLVVNAQQALGDWSGLRCLVVASRWDERDRMVQVSVIDSGPGIPLAIRSRIFEPFFTTKPVGVGTGIGLSVCHSIVTAHGGTIEVAEAEGGGTCFVIRLPGGNGTDAAAGRAEDIVPASAGGRVLIVDDDPDIAQTLAEILVQGSYRIDMVDSGHAALERIRDADYAAVLSDIRMPRMDGMELYRRLREQKPDLAQRLILITGDALSPVVAAFLEETGQPHIEKPFVPAEVRRLVAATVESFRPE